MHMDTDPATVTIIMIFIFSIIYSMIFIIVSYFVYLLTKTHIRVKEFITGWKFILIVTSIYPIAGVIVALLSDWHAGL
jgi:hypothetical protein